jgi:hypothetical protein
MIVHLVVHHRNDPHQPWVNSWLDDEKLEAIQTTTDIGRMCRDLLKERISVRVHRCAWNDNPPIVCCKALVADASEIDRATWLVRFTGQETLIEQPASVIGRGINYYLA